VTAAEKFLNDLKQGKCFVVINDCYGGFGLSARARSEYCRLAGLKENDCSERDIRRDDPYLVKVVKELGMGANGPHSNLKIVEIPGDVEWLIQDYDGAEWVAEKHRTWN
jgi:hypothetical protein